MIRRGPPRDKGPRELPHAGDRPPNNGIVSRTAASAYRILNDHAGDPDASLLERSLARAAAVLLHRLMLVIATGADRDVDAAVYLRNTPDTATRTTGALLESLLDPQFLSDGN